MTINQPGNSPFIKHRAIDPAEVPVAEPGLTEDGRAKVSLTMPTATAAAMTALLEGRPVDPAELPRLRALMDQILPASAAARRLAGEDPGAERVPGAAE
ncbi:hypothetical protein KDK95_05625 [Actinospica sp. MGRD01-02]|uniref:Uncharacterized protein n=1 Tax=Actinospica acidithermotolerans TaxID=2828514 RepID=A0A941IG66_9ACTN|nr:hypothetical protein [Actinospica acidithermotolerans]MBR7825779.1 hypothetical protein [Actinospica acidithermotolerans]